MRYRQKYYNKTPESKSFVELMHHPARPQIGNLSPLKQNIEGPGRLFDISSDKIHDSVDRIKASNVAMSGLHREFLKKQMAPTQSLQGKLLYQKVNEVCYKPNFENKNLVSPQKLLKFDGLDSYHSSRQEYLQNRVKIGLFPDKELDPSGKIAFTRKDHYMTKNRQRPSFFHEKLTTEAKP
jgi:hypothetical protein